MISTDNNSFYTHKKKSPPEGSDFFVLNGGDLSAPD